MDTNTPSDIVQKPRSIGRVILRITGKFFLFLGLNILLIALALYGIMFVLAKGPSPSARNLFVLSVRETSAVGFLANLFFSEEEINQMLAGGNEIPSETMDPSLIVIPPPSDPDADTPEGPVTDAWGLVDEDNDGIILEKVTGEGYIGYMMVVLDPSRVVMACDVKEFGFRGFTVAEMVERYDAVAGINAGGFDDPNGKGNGSTPDTLVVSDGQIYYPEKGVHNGFVGFDKNHILHTGYLSTSEILEREIQSGVCFGPVLVSNGVPVDNYSSGINPRTAIGQRSDGAILMLVIEGRQVTSLGATYQDVTEVMLSYGAVNACNLDGGSSTMMWYQGDYVNRCASVFGVRPLPTTFLVLKKEADTND